MCEIQSILITATPEAIYKRGASFTHLNGIELCAHAAAVGAVEGGHKVGHGGAIVAGHRSGGGGQFGGGEDFAGAEAVSGGLQLGRIRARGPEKIETNSNFL